MLLDTSGIFALLDERESDHEVAVTYYAAAPSRLLHSYVMAELVPLARSRRLARDRVIEYLNADATDDEVEKVWVDAALHAAGLALLVDRPDKAYSLCDAVSFELMRDRGLTDALTTDHHFTQEGFRKLLG